MKTHASIAILCFSTLSACKNPKPPPAQKCDPQPRPVKVSAPSCPPCGTVIGRYSSRLKPRKSGDKWGYVDGGSNWVIPGKWKQASYFSPY